MSQLVVKTRSVRGIMFYASGQRCEGWVPKGTYNVVGHSLLSRDGRVGSEMVPAVKIADDYGTWYVGRHAVCTCGMVAMEGKDNTPVEHGMNCLLWTRRHCHQEG